MENSKNLKERDKTLDTAKGILILLMIVGHVFLEGRVRSFIYTFHMPAFLIITGILYSKSSSLSLPTGKFIKRKIRSLIIPFIFFEIIGVITDIICHGITLNIKGYVYNTLTQNWNNGAVGFLIHTFIAQLTFYIINRIFPKKITKIVVISVLVILAFLLPSSFNSIFRISFIYVGFLAEGFYFFCQFKSDNKAIFASFLLTLLISLFEIYISNCFGSVMKSIIYLIGANTGSVFIIQLSKRINLPILTYYGRNSIILLGTHNLILLPLRTYLPYSFSLAVSLLILITIFVLEYPITILINKYVPALVGYSKNKHC